MAITDRSESASDRDDIDLTTGDVAGIVDRVRAAYSHGRTRPMEWRQEQLDGLVRMLKMEGPRFEAALASDLGKPAVEGFAADVGSVASEIAAMRKHAPHGMPAIMASIEISSAICRLCRTSIF